MITFLPDIDRLLPLFIMINVIVGLNSHNFMPHLRTDPSHSFRSLTLCLHEKH